MQEKTSFRAVNLLFFSVVCLQVSNVFFMWMPQYVRLILNETFFVFLPAYVYLRLTRQPVAERVRWQWPGWKLAILSLLTGLGLYPLSAASAGVFLTLLGYTNFAGPQDAIPTTLLMSVLAVIAYAVMAPLCEEFLFRGVIQPVYEQRGPKWAVLFVGFLFIAFHLSLLQGLSIILLALALGLVNYRTRSLPASVLTHVGANSLAALVITQGVFKTGIQNWIVSIPAILGGLVIAAAALAGLIWQTRRPVEEQLTLTETAFATQPARPAWLTQGWPLLAAGGLYLAMAGAEFYFARSPQLTAQPLQVGSSPWQTTQAWEYEIRNAADTVVGDADCQLVPDSAVIEITCRSTVEAYEVKTNNNSTFSSSGGERIDQLSWHAADGSPVFGKTALNLMEGTYTSTVSWTMSTRGFDLRRIVEGEEEQIFDLPFSETPLAKDFDLLVAPDYTWPWQLAGVELAQGTSGNVARFNAYTWRNDTQDSGPLVENRLVTVSGPEEVTTPAGKFTAWKVMLGSDQTAWFEANDSHSLVKFNNGIETWSLK